MNIPEARVEKKYAVEMKKVENGAKSPFPHVIIIFDRFYLYCGLFI